MSNEKTKVQSAAQLAHMRAKQVNCRKAEKPPVMPACRNCRSFTYDESDRMGSNGYTVYKIGQRCVALDDVHVTTNLLCDLHVFQHADRRDV